MRLAKPASRSLLQREDRPAEYEEGGNILTPYLLSRQVTDWRIESCDTLAEFAFSLAVRHRQCERNTA